MPTSPPSLPASPPALPGLMDLLDHELTLDETRRIVAQAREEGLSLDGGPPSSRGWGQVSWVMLCRALGLTSALRALLEAGASPYASPEIVDSMRAARRSKQFKPVDPVDVLGRHVREFCEDAGKSDAFGATSWGAGQARKWNQLLDVLLEAGADPFRPDPLLGQSPWELMEQSVRRGEAMDWSPEARDAWLYWAGKCAERYRDALRAALRVEPEAPRWGIEAQWERVVRQVGLEEALPRTDDGGLPSARPRL